MYSKVCHLWAFTLLNPNSLHAHTHTHTLCSVSKGNVCVTHGHIWISKSACVCVCVRVQFLPLNSLLLVWPPMDALLGLSLSLIICLIDVKAKRHKEGLISDKKKIKILLWLLWLLISFTKKPNVGDSLCLWPPCMCEWWMKRGD